MSSRKKYIIKPTRKQKKIISKYVIQYNKISDEYWGKVSLLEMEMAKDTEIQDIEFFFCDGEFAGVGNVSRTMELIHR
jgi:hypothetical protein